VENISPGDVPIRSKFALAVPAGLIRVITRAAKDLFQHESQ
jgi:hypothetical protein